jgi:hypothetical protein
VRLTGAATKKEKIMGETKSVPTNKEDELSESEIADISGGLNPQPLPPGIIAPDDRGF